MLTIRASSIGTSSPENILLDRLGRVKVADFGIAKLADSLAEISADGQPGACHLTETGKVMGTPAYMAPEQMASPESVDHRADIYALGAVFYQMLTGDTPKTETEPPSSKVSIDVRLDDIVLRALERNPLRRYQQVSEIRTKLDSLATESPKTRQGFSGLKIFLLASAVVVAINIMVVAVIFFQNFRQSQKLNNPTLEGWRLWEEGRLREATNAFREAVNTDPSDANAWNGLGWALFNAGKITEAMPAFEKAVALDPDQPGALNGLGQIALTQGDFKAAEKFLLKAAPNAPAAWFGLTRLYLLQGQFDKALPWARKMTDSGQNDALTKSLLAAAEAGRLDQKLRRRISPASESPPPSSEPPRLRALAWLDEASRGVAWNDKGESRPLSDLGVPPALVSPTDLDVSRTPAAALNPRFLCLWISQPGVDSQSVAQFKLLHPDGTALEVPSSDIATGMSPASSENGGLGWLTATICAGTMTSTPRHVTIHLRFSGGPWLFRDEFTPAMQGFRSLANGIQLTPPGQGNDGRAFVQITKDTSIDSGNEQWDFVAHLKDGRRVERNGLSQSASGGVRTERFFFDVPLSQVARFEIRTRPIQTKVWRNVPLRAGNDHQASQGAPGKVKSSPESR
jgi:tetratricopeptide (TPR) repeat protein